MNWMRIWQWLLDAFWLIFLIILLAYFWRERRRLKRQRWFLTQGTITQFLWSKKGYQIWPKIEYSYQVFDQTFQGTLFFPNSPHTNLNSKRARKLAYRVAEAYERNEDIAVYYNPQNPGEAVLDINPPFKLNLIILILVSLILLHCIILLIRFL